jgi:1,4-dihydroxy-2-naphthoate octaprenyltransferase
MKIREKLKGWILIMRLQFMPFVVFPYILGSVMLVHEPFFSVEKFVIGICITTLIFIIMVVISEVMDLEGDIINSTEDLMSGGSKVLVNKILTKKEIFVFTFIMHIILAGLYIYIFLNWKISDAVIYLVFGLAGYIISVGYSVPPLKINYRGGGEFATGIGMGILPLMGGYFSQAGAHFSPVILYYSIPLSMYHFMTKHISEIPDLDADIKVGKKTTIMLTGIKGGFYSVSIVMILNMTFVLTTGILGIAGKIDFSPVAAIGIWLSIPLMIMYIYKNFTDHNTDEKSIVKVMGMGLILWYWHWFVLMVYEIFLKRIV